MKIIESEAIVLRNFSLAEADQIILCFTKKNGLVRLGVRGAKRLKSRFSGRLEPFTVVEVIYGQREETELGRLFQAEVVQSHFHLAARLNVFTALSYLSEIFTVLTPPHEPNEVLYRMVRVCLTAIDEAHESLIEVRLIVVYFEIWLLRLGGFLPDFQACNECRAAVRDQPVYYFGNEARLLCAQCVETNRRNLAVTLPPRLLKVLQAALVAPPLRFVQIACQRQVGLESLENITHRLLRKILEYDPSYWSTNFEFEDNVRKSIAEQAA